MKIYAEIFAIVVLSVLFTLALVFVTIQTAELVNRVFLAAFPDWGASFDFERMGKTTAFLRPIGYASFLAISILILLGFVAGRTRLGKLGSLGFFLPTFGYFAFTMFALSGIGVLRALWFPLFDLSSDIVGLGKIVCLPHLAATMFVTFMASGITGMPAQNIPFLVSEILADFGLGLFFLGAMTWLYGKLKHIELIDFWIYRFSRHPQYLGFLIWSYGILISASLAASPKGGQMATPTLPWLISSLTIVAVAIKEENAMVKKYGRQYAGYRNKTPFLFPLPRQLCKIITAPIKVIFKKTWPERNKEIITTILIYGGLLVLASFLMVSISFLFLVA